MLFLRGPPLWQICMRRQSVKCLHCPALQFNFIGFFFFVFVHYSKFHLITWLRKCVFWECDIDKWAITGAIFTCHVCGQHDPRLALLMLNVRCESWACQHSRLRRRRGPFWHVIHHWFHLAATAVSLSPSHRPLTPLRTHSRMIKYLSGISDNHPVSLTEDKKKNPLSFRFVATVTSLSIRSI